MPIELSAEGIAEMKKEKVFPALSTSQEKAMEDWQQTYQLQKWLEDYEESRATLDDLPADDDFSQILNGGSYKGMTLLHALVMSDDLSAVKGVLERGANPHVVDAEGSTPLHCVSAYGLYRCCNLILSHSSLSGDGKSLVNVKNKEGKTALHYAAEYRNTHVYKLLLENGADDGIQDAEGMAPRDIFKNGTVSELYSIRPVENHQYNCPYCHKMLQTWHINGSGKEVGSPSGPLATDGDTVWGVTEAVKWTETDPCDWGLELARSCLYCKEKGFFVTANFMSRKYSGEEYESRLSFCTEPGRPEYFKVNLNELEMKRINGMTFDARSNHQPEFLVPHWPDVEFSGGCWHFTEYKSETLPPMQAHRIGPFQIRDIDNIQGPYGVSVCTGAGTEWDYAKDLLVSLFPYFWDIADQRERQWVEKIRKGSKNVTN